MRPLKVRGRVVARGIICAVLAIFMVALVGCGWVSIRGLPVGYEPKNSLDEMSLFMDRATKGLKAYGCPDIAAMPELARMMCDDTIFLAEYEFRSADLERARISEEEMRSPEIQERLALLNEIGVKGSVVIIFEYEHSTTWTTFGQSWLSVYVRWVDESGKSMIEVGTYRPMTSAIEARSITPSSVNSYLHGRSGEFSGDSFRQCLEWFFALYFSSLPDSSFSLEDLDTVTWR